MTLSVKSAVFKNVNKEKTNQVPKLSRVRQELEKEKTIFIEVSLLDNIYTFLELPDPRITYLENNSDHKIIRRYLNYIPAR